MTYILWFWLGGIAPSAWFLAKWTIGVNQGRWPKTKYGYKDYLLWIIATLKWPVTITFVGVVEFVAWYSDPTRKYTRA